MCTLSVHTGTQLLEYGLPILKSLNNSFYLNYTLIKTVIQISKDDGVLPAYGKMCVFNKWP